MTLRHIDEKKKLLDKKRPLPVNTVKSLRESMLVEWTYNTNAIEGNTLTISETRVRDILIHEYSGVDLELVWETVQTSLPYLKMKRNNISVVN